MASGSSQSQRDSANAYNLFSNQMIEAGSPSSVLPEENAGTDSVDECAISIRVECDVARNPLTQVQDPAFRKRHGEDDDPSKSYLSVSSTSYRCQDNDRSVNFNIEDDEVVTRRSSKFKPVSKWKLVGNILSFRNKTRAKIFEDWSATKNRVSHLNTQLLNAIKEHNNHKIESIIKAGANPNATCRGKHISACHAAAAYANNDALRLLLQHNANKDRRDKEGRTPLHLAAWSGKTGTIAMLLDFPTDLQNKVMFEVTPEAEEEIRTLRPRLQSMVEVPCENLEVPNLSQTSRDSIEHKCKRYMMHLPTFFFGWTPLHIASYAAHHDAVRLLLAAGANPNSCDELGQTPLDIAGAACYFETHRINVIEYVKTIKTLIDSGGKLNVLDTTPSNSPLHTAVELGSLDAIELLLAAGAPTWRLNPKGNTPLHECVANRSKEPLQLLANHNQSVDVVDSSGHTALHAAIFTSWVSGVCVALAAGADVTFEAHDGQTAIHIAALKGDLDILNEILRSATQYRNSVNYDYDNCRAELPVFCAIRSGNIKCVQAFLKAGVSLQMSYYLRRESVDTTTSVTDWGPIYSNQLTTTNIIVHATAEVGSVEMLQLILNHDKKLEELLYYKCPDLDSMIPVEVAALHNRFDTFKFLLQKTLERSQAFQVKFDHSRLMQITRNKDKLLNELLVQIPNAVRTINRKVYYPLHSAATNGNRKLIEQLINNGADLSEPNQSGVTAVSLVIDNISQPTEFLAKIFDDYIKIDNTNSEMKKITVDYRVLIPSSEDESGENDQMRVLNALLQTEDRHQRKLLAHPLIESFLHLKWKVLSIYFYMMVILYCLFIMSLSIQTMSVFYYTDKHNATVNKNVYYPPQWDPRIWQYIVYATLSIVVIQELSCSNLSFEIWAVKCFSFEFCLKLVTYSLAIATPLVISFEPEQIDFNEIDWKRHLATITLVIAWTNIMMMLSKIPTTGYYIEMFLMVLSKVIEIFLTFSFLMLMFAFCFMIQFHSKPPFEGPWASLVKTLVMMTSEFDYGGTFTREKAHELASPIQVLRIIFVVFLILTAIVLMNLMTGVAVHDVQNLVQDGNLRRLEKQVKFLNNLEVCRRRKKSIIHIFGLYRCMKSDNVPQTVTFRPVNNDKCPYSSSIKEAIINKVHEQLNKIERQEEARKLELKLEKLSQDVWKKLGSKFEKFSQNVTHRLESKSEALSHDVLRHIFEMKSKLTHIQDSLNEADHDKIKNNY